MKNNFEIKLLTECQEHIPVLATLWFEEISKQWIPNSSVMRAQQNLIEHLNQDHMPMTFVALSENKPIGMASLRKNDGIQPALAPWLGSLVVHPHYRKRKVGEMLIEVTKIKARHFGYEKIYLLAFDLTIPNWYEKLGWKTIDVDQLCDHPVTVMSIAL